MTSNSIKFLAFAAIALLAVPASAQSFAQLHKGGARGEPIIITEAGGLVNYDGTILTGTNYSVSHTKQGVYTISYNAGPWAWSAIPAVTCTPAGQHVALTTCIVQNGINDGATIRIYKLSNGKLVNNGFSFTAVATH